MRRGNPWRWRVDEVCVKARGDTHYLWRAVDHKGEVLEAYFTKKCDKAVALKCLGKEMNRVGNPGVIMTDISPSYYAAMKVSPEKAGCRC